MHQLQQQQRAAVRCSSRVGTGYCCYQARQQKRSGRLHIAAAASVEQQIDSGVDHLHLIAPDATQLIGNTPMVGCCLGPFFVVMVPVKV
jgi:hypothetical protein